jgi:hypothetical protein
VDHHDQQDIRSVARQWLAVNVLHDSPQCFVWSPSADWFRIPRQYWWKADWTMTELVQRVGLNPTFDYADVIDAPPDLHGQQIVVWRESVEALIDANRKPGRIAEPTPSAELSAPVVMSDHSGAPGRPSSMHLIKAEMRKRHKDGRMSQSVGAEARALKEWFESEEGYQALARPGRGAIENGIREAHRELKATK